MRDVFYTLLTVWVVWRIYQAFTTKSSHSSTGKDFFEHDKDANNITIKNNSTASKKISDDEGEYVDFEEIK